MKHIKTRVFSFVALSALVGGCAVVGREGYFVATDSWVAPAILTPQNDIVLEQKMKLEQILLEKGRAEQALAEADGDLEAGEKAVLKLNELKDFASNALTWTKTTTGAQVSMGNADMGKLSQQKDALNQMLTRQALIVDESKKNLDAGLVQRPEYDRELQTLDQVQIALFENERTRMSSQLLLGQAMMGQQALRGGSNMPMPEQVMSMNQLITIECQLLQTEADMRAKMAEKKKDQEELNKIEGLENDLRARPLFKAIEENQDIAFATYSGLRDIQPGARLMSCVWAIFNCQEVGRVSNIVPGEISMPDPFGSGQVRGQLITLTLERNEHDDAMQSKLLRVRYPNKFSLPTEILTKK